MNSKGDGTRDHSIHDRTIPRLAEAVETGGRARDKIDGNEGQVIKVFDCGASLS